MKSQDLTQYNLPKNPGVYFFMEGKKILYIGKATSLKDRVKSYFSKDLIQTRGAHIVDMVFRATSIKYQETDSVLEALILEANLIKKHKPYYNTKEKDDKSWNYVCITKESLPKVLIERGKNIDFKKMTVREYKLASVHGPFTSGGQLKIALRIIRKIFPFIDISSAKKDNYEFYKQLGLAPETNEKDVSTEYQKNIKNIQRFFEGKKKAILTEITKRMKQLAKEERFEEAALLRNQLFALDHINDVALLKEETQVYQHGFRIEAYDVAHLSGKDMVGVMTVIENGEVNKKEYRTFNIKGFTKANDTGALEELLSRRFRHTEWGIADLVVIDGGEAQVKVAEQVLDRYQLEIPLVAVVKDERHKPKDILGHELFAKKYKKEILLANSEAHRFAITTHKKKRGKSFLKT